MKKQTRPVPIRNQQVVFLRSNAVAPDPRVEKAAQALAQAGYHVKVFAWDRQHVAPRHERTGSLEFFRSRIRGAYGSGQRNLIPLVRWQFSLLGWLLKHVRRGSIVHACDFDTVWPAWLASRLKGARLVYDIFDFYADNVSGLSPRARARIAAAERWMIGHADALILAGENRAAQLGTARPIRLTVIENTPPDVNPAGQVALPDRFTVCYVGQLLYNRGLTSAIEVIGRHPHWQMFLAGFGADANAIRAQASAHTNITAGGQIAYPRAVELMRASSVLLALYDPREPNHRYASPNKLFEAMMLGKPVIAARGTGFDEWVRKQRIGMVVDYDDQPGLEAALQHLADNPADAREIGARARGCYQQQYSWAEMERRLLALYADLA